MSVKIELVQRAIRVGAVAVRVVRPHRVELARERGLTNVVTIVDAVARRRCVREPAAQALARRPGRAAIGTEGAVVFRVIVRNVVRAVHAVVIAAIMKAYCHGAGCAIDCDVGQKLAPRGRVVVHANRRAPRPTVIIRRAHHYVGVIVLVDCLVCVHEVDAVVEGSTRRVPHHTGLSVDRAFALRRDKVEAAHIGVGNCDLRAETARPQTVRVYVRRSSTGPGHYTGSDRSR